MSVTEADLHRIMNQLEDALDRAHMVEQNIPKARWFPFRLDSGYSFREIAIAENEYRRGAEFILCELRWQLHTGLYVHDRPSPTDPSYGRVSVDPDGPKDRQVFKGRATLSVIPESSNRGRGVGE